MNESILLLGAGSEQLTAIRLAQTLGLQVIAVDGNPDAVGLPKADEGINEDILDVEEMVRIGKEHEVDGVFCHAVEIPHVVARVADRLDLHGLPPDIVDRATFKHQRIQCLSEHGVSIPEFEFVDGDDDYVKAATEVGFPLVVKPVDRSGARGVSLVREQTQLSEAVELARSYGRTDRILFEEYLRGPEISTESVIIDGEIFTTGFADRNYQRKTEFFPALIEDGHTVPSSLPKKARELVIDEVKAAIRALDIQWGVAKGDVLLSDSEPVILEMSPRTSGGRFCGDVVPLATGVQILKPLLEMAVGRDPDRSDLEPNWNRAASQRFFFPPSGELKRINGYETVRTMPGVYDVVIADKVFLERNIPPIESHADRIGHVIASAGGRDDAIKRAESAIERLEFDVRQ